MSKALRYFVYAIMILALTLGSLAMAPAAQGQGGKYFVVQFTGPIEDAWKEAVSAEGGEILAYIPDFAFKVRMNPAAANRVGQMEFVGAVTPYPSQFKFSADLKRDGEMNLYQIRVEQGSDYGLVRSLVARTGAEILGYDGDIMIVAANTSFLDAIAEVEDVASISNYLLNQTFSTTSAPLRNDTARDIIGATIANNRGYDGSSQIAAVSDTGLGGGTAATAHSGIPSSRIVNIYNWPGAKGGCFTSVSDDGAVDVDSGHGTHTASSVLNAGGAGGIGRGIAPAAHLVFQATENWATVSSYCQLLGGYPANGYFLLGLPSDLKTMYQQAYNAGARIHSNSWGAAVAGDYTTDSMNTDSFVWTNRDMVITFSAGNEGVDANADGIVDNDSMGAPATSKNVITIGASENARADNYPCDLSLTYTSSDVYQNGQTCASMGGVNLLGTAGSRWGFTAAPLNNDLTAGNAQQMAPFSSRGPTDDSRIKPDVVAPGTWILSGASSMYEQGYGTTVNPKNGAYQWDGWGMPYNSQYKYMGGTSMSNPIAAGGATVVKDYYNKAYSGMNASAALVKATLINSAVDLLDENNDGANDNDYPIPNMHEGWGLINLDAATDGTIKFVDEGTGLSTNGTQTFNVTTTGGPLKVTLVWSDYQSTDTATVNLVNDLDLTVAGPGGTYLGNAFSGGWSTTGGTADRRNNVENVYLQSPAAGIYTVTVKGYNIPNGPQKFALAVDGGAISAPPAPTSTGFLAPSAQAAVTTSAGDNNGYETGPTNAFVDDGTVATDLNSGSNTNTSCTNTGKDKHVFSNYNFNIPSTAAILGIQVRLDARADATSGSPKICVEISSDGGATWTAARQTATLGKNEATYSLGSTSDTWGRSWTSANFGNTGFRVRVTDVSSNASRDFYLDYIAVNVTYQP
jgi:hypothetical protein